MSVAVYGIGNVLRRDDGFGPSAVRRFEACHVLPEGVITRDLGTPGLDLPSHLVGHEAVVFLDAATGIGPPGLLRVYDRDALLAAAGAAPHVSGHEADVRASLEIAELAGDGPTHVWLVGVVPADLGDGTGLTQAVQAAIDPACAQVLELLAALGIEVTDRAEPEATGAWWETAAVA